jgi:hypothetical protein
MSTAETFNNYAWASPPDPDKWMYYGVLLFIALVVIALVSN